MKPFVVLISASNGFSLLQIHVFIVQYIHLFFQSIFVRTSPVPDMVLGVGDIMLGKSQYFLSSGAYILVRKIGSNKRY